jgi:uncharacterized NAD(P)/FAD-binding protein YdhS
MRTFAIVGAGFGGTMTCVHLLRLLAEQARAHGETGPIAQVMLIERSGRFTAGVAYSTAFEGHVLNVPAGRMSALPDDGDHFLRWARVHDPRTSGGSFVRRRMYGRYIAALLDETEAASKPFVRVQRVSRSAMGLRLEPDAVIVELEGGTDIRADHVVLAIGNFPPGNPEIQAAAWSWVHSWRYAKDPWAAGALDVDPDGDVLLLGTGLTMLDIAIALKEQGHRGTIHAVSRRGLLPQPHRVSIRPPTPHKRPASIEHWPATTRGLLRAVRDEIRVAAKKGIDWREVVTALRDDTPALWQRMSIEERKRFLRHVRPFWETHRHRAAPDTATTISELIARGELVVHPGFVLGFSEDEAGVGVRIRERGAEHEQVLRVARVINCTGPQTDLRDIGDPFMQGLVDEGIVRPDALGLGLDTTQDGAVIDAHGEVHSRISLVGPLRKGLLWENTAVPELRVEARAMALKLVDENRRTDV